MKTNPRSFKDLTAEQQDRIDAYLNGSISAEAFAALQQELMASPELRALLRRYLALDHHLQEMLVKVDTASESWLGSEDAPPVAAKPKPRLWVSGWMPVAAAAVLAFFLGLSSLFWGRGSGGNSGGLANNAAEPSAEGFAVVGSLFDSVWSEPGNAYREGDTLGAEVFRLATGTAEIQFFSGATMTVQGPAEITLKSAWEATCQEGVVRMQVPPAARGFKLRSPSSEIVDLGTEFGLQVIDGQAHVEVFDGEIAIRHKDESERLVQEGAAWGLPSGGSSVPSELGKIAFPDVSQFGLRAVEQRQFDFNQWNLFLYEATLYFQFKTIK